jgi:hypothetical protein
MQQYNKFNNGKIYRIDCNVTGLVYIGSTIKTLSQRLRKHESDYKSYLKKQLHYVTSFTILENDDYNITLIKNYPCLSRKELTDMEGEYIRFKHVVDEGECVNKVVPGRTRAQYRIDNDHIIKEKSRIYRKDSQDKIKANAKIYREKNRETINEKQNNKRWKKMYPNLNLP